MTSTPAFNRPNGLALDSNHNLYVANLLTPNVTEYATGGMTAGTWAATPSQTISGATMGQPTGLALSLNQLYVSNGTSNNVTVYNATTGAQIAAQTIALASSPNDVFIDPATQLLYVASSTAGTIAVYQTNTLGTAFPLVTTITTTNNPWDMAIQ